ncbi:MAG: DUF6634 family protein [Paracoccaceae bacterium]
MNDAHDLDQLRRNVSIHGHATLPPYVRLADIPQPWLDRFLEALVGSQAPVIEGEGQVAYEADWALFLRRAERRQRARHIAEILKYLPKDPSPDVLGAAPVLDPWFVVRDPSQGLCLRGAVLEHPRLPGVGQWIVTSMLIGINLEAGCARTASRWYRLGKMVAPAECEALRGAPSNPALAPVGIDEVTPWFARLRTLLAREGFDV